MMIMADIPLDTHHVVSGHQATAENGEITTQPGHETADTNLLSSELTAQMLENATHISVNDMSVNSHGHLALPLNPEMIDAVLLQGTDLVIVDKNGAIVIVDEFLGGLGSGAITGMTSPDGTTIEAIEFLDTFGSSGALEDLMYSMETAENHQTDANQPPALSSDASMETFDFSHFSATPSSTARDEQSATEAPFATFHGASGALIQPINYDQGKMTETAVLDETVVLDRASSDKLDHYLAPHNPGVDANLAQAIDQTNAVQRDLHDTVSFQDSETFTLPNSASDEFGIL
jgi:hypothetical protein